MRGIGRIHLPQRPERVLMIGAGALHIGQGGEFDYSGTQALKALREEGIATVLLNPNIATVQTSEGLAEATYFYPVNAEFAEKVIAREHVDAILLGFGGQTALNCGLELDARGVLAKHGVRVLGTSTASIRVAEDRDAFAKAMRALGVEVAKGSAATTVEEAMAIGDRVGWPVIVRSGFSLGGKASSIVHSRDELAKVAARALRASPRILVEESLIGWKEIEYEIVRDADDNCIAVCNMENVDPVGIHTGDSIVVAPAQTLNDEEHQMLRTLSLRVIRSLGIVGECNIQFALSATGMDYRVIEVNPRLSRSSALASKATGYPLAYVAAKLVLGYTLPQLANAVTRTTSAFFEPALDYVVTKVPRWDFAKFDGAVTRIGTEMRSVGEVMAIGRNFGESLQKALRMLEVGADGFDPYVSGAYDPGEDVETELTQPTNRRIFALARALARGVSPDHIIDKTQISPFFVGVMSELAELRRRLEGCGKLEKIDEPLLREAKVAGFSDAAIARAVKVKEHDVREKRRGFGIRPGLSQIDTLAGEHPAQTNYLYLSYGASVDDVPPSTRKKVLVLGSGCYRIGSSVEFDWCCVNAVVAARDLGYETILLNSNPETVSTDYDVCERLVFDEISLETVLELWDKERPEAVISSFGGQTPNSLALKLQQQGVKLLGTPADSIDCAEDRRRFSALCDTLGIAQPKWREATTTVDLGSAVEELDGFPILVRPSYVLSGAAMRIARSEPDLRAYLAAATSVSPEHPVVMSKYERHAREIEFDGVAKDGEIILWAMAEHIEEAGVHSGDASLIVPPQNLYLATVNRARRAVIELARALKITGPFNVQLIARDNHVKIIECNLRASRSFPLVSKLLGVNFVTEAVRAMLGSPSRNLDRRMNPLYLDRVAVKVAQFSFDRLPGVDPVSGVEMASTGEVACFSSDPDEALLLALRSVGWRVPSKGVLLSLGPVGDKYRFAEEARMLAARGLALYATAGTAEILAAEGITTVAVGKESSEGQELTGADALRRGLVDFVINIPREYDEHGQPDGRLIRRAAVDLGVPLITNLALARRVVRAMDRMETFSNDVTPWQAHLH